MGKVISRLINFENLDKIKTLYHGTVNIHLESICKGIDCKKSEVTKDFGKGFYLTSNESHAIRTARKNAKHTGALPVVIKFKLNDELYESIYSILTFNSNDEEWLGFIFSNKNPRKKQATKYFPNFYSGNYDIIYGPLADGVPRYLTLINEFEKLEEVTEEDKQDLMNAIKKGYKFPDIDQIMFNNQEDVNNILKLTEVKYIEKR